MSQPSTVRPPRQYRSRQSLERILQAGLEVLAEGGYDAFTVDEVCRRAQVSIGSVYNRFGSKHALFLTIHTRFVGAINEESRQAPAFDPQQVAHLGIDEVIDGAVAEVAAAFDRHSSSLRAFMLRAATDEAVAEQASAGIRDLAWLFGRVILTRSAEIAHPEPTLAVDFCFRTVYATLWRRLVFGPTFESELNPTWARLVDELGSMCKNHLLRTPAN